MAKFEMSWEAPEFEYHEKDVSWYWISIIIAALIIAFSVWERNYLFGLFVVIAEVLIILWANQEPPIVLFTLRDDGLEVGTAKFHTLKEFESWSADGGDPWVEMKFNFRAKLKTPLALTAPADTLDEIRKNLKPLLPEVEHEITLIEAIEKLLRF